LGFNLNIVASSTRAKAVLITPFFFDVSDVRSYKLSPAVVPFVKEKTKTEQDETTGVAVSTNNVANTKTEIGNTEQTAKMLKDEIGSLEGEQRAAIILEANLIQGEGKRIFELADTTLQQLDATITDSYAQLRRTTGLTALD
jgi:hypothetical protein